MMKYILALATTALLVGCQSNENKPLPETPTSTTLEIAEWNVEFNQAQVVGSTLVYDESTNTYYSNNTNWTKSRFLPASTFKIPNSMVALETGVIESDTTVIPWNGKKHRFKVWEQDLTLKEAFHYSCVPCYQSIARKVGLTRMKEQLAKLNFGQMEVSDSTLDLFWLEGNSSINSYEQIDFLKRFNHSELPITNKTESTMKDLMIITQNDSITLRGKTGWSNQGGINNGWFVGYVERDNKTYYFATNIEPLNTLPLKEFAALRKTLTYSVLEQVYSK